MDDPDGPLAHELAVATEAARRAGEEVARMRTQGLRYGRKEGWELVTEADLHAAEMLHAAITSVFPGDGWMSEEHTDTSHRLGMERVWVVDPIDGTKEYLQGLDQYAISVALVVDGVPELGVVFNPARDEMFAAAVGEAVPGAGRIAPSRFDVLVGRGEQDWDEIPPLPPGAKTRGVGSVAYRLALVAAGKGEATLSGYGRAEWDVAAGVALCRAAGVLATDILGMPMAFNQPNPYVRGFLAAAPGLHGLMLDHLHRRRW